jgi:hypothetical protein
MITRYTELLGHLELPPINRRQKPVDLSLFIPPEPRDYVLLSYQADFPRAVAPITPLDIFLSWAEARAGLILCFSSMPRSPILCRASAREDFAF